MTRQRPLEDVRLFKSLPLIHMIVEAPDAVALARAMKGLEVRMARGLNRVMARKGPVFADRYHAHLLRTPTEARYARNYVLSNWRVHAQREGRPLPRGIDPFSSAGCDPGATCSPRFWMLCVGIWRGPPRERATMARCDTDAAQVN